MKRFLVFILMVWSISRLVGQETPTDFLSADFHKGRREALREKMPVNSVAVFFANAERNRSNDVDYVYHQDPDFYYLTGYKEPNSVLVIFSDKQKGPEGKEYDEILFVQERNARHEQWTGKRLGVEGAKDQLGFETAFNGIDFKNTSIDFKKFEKVMFLGFHNDYRNLEGEADLFDLVKSFKDRTDYPSDYSVVKERLYEMIKSAETDHYENLTETLSRYRDYYQELKEDALLEDFISAKDKGLRNELKERVILEIRTSNLNSSFLNTIMDQLREIKAPEEIALMKKAIEISAVGQIEVMKAMHPNMSETEVQGIHEYVYKKYGAEYEGYPSIVGGGGNGCILHYIENNKTRLGNDLVLMDLGAEYHGYTADVTRTIPANGKFSPEQKQLYDIVLNAQEAGIKASVAGAGFNAPDSAARHVVTQGLMQLGIIGKEEDSRIYFPHGTSHYLGLDVHDRGAYGPLKENMVITVEPGIYIPEGSNCDKKWWGIAVRIEDDILITANGPVTLSSLAPRTTDAIEALMRQPSPLDHFVLPKLD